MASVLRPLSRRLRQLAASLRVALILTVLVGIAVPAGITLYLEQVRLNERVTQQLQADVRKTSELFANGVKDAVWQMSKPDADAIAAAAFADQRIVSIDIRDKDGQSFTSLQRPGAKPSATQSHSTEMFEANKKIGQVTVTMDEDSKARQLEEALDMSLRLVFQSLLGAVLLIGLTLHFRLIKPVQRLVAASATLARGELSTPIESVRTDEIGQLARSMDMTRLALAEQIKEVAEIAAISAELQKAQTLDALGSKLVTWLRPRMGVGQASLYVADEATQMLRLAYTFARPRNYPLPEKIPYGEGMLGQVGIDQQAVHIDRPTGGNLRIESGLGEAVPRAILIQPIKINDTLLGVLELAMLEPFGPDKKLMLERLLVTFAMCMEILDRNQRSQDGQGQQSPVEVPPEPGRAASLDTARDAAVSA